MLQLLWLEMALFSKKALHNHIFESLGSGFVIFEKKNFVLAMAHGDPSFAKVEPKNSNF